MTSQRKISEVEALTSVRADEAFDIHIGKTPPRKESEWFSPNSNNNVVWMSIKDMGCGDVYLMDSSEYLTQKAVAKHNMKLCKPGSVLLSFKLTIGRVGIVSKEMTTNEAIACFSSDDPRKLAYLYPLLKSYDYASLGSTSSIATAVNSKMIKSMLLRMPSTSVLDQFYEQTKPLYEMLQNKVKENVSLTALRDVLLPKLMSGEIDVSKVDLTQLTNNHLLVLGHNVPNRYWKGRLWKPSLIMFCRRCRTCLIRHSSNIWLKYSESRCCQLRKHQRRRICWRCFSRQKRSKAARRKPLLTMKARFST